MDYMYDESGGIKKAFLKLNAESFSTYYDYNPVGQPSRIRQENKHGDVVSDEQLTFDENGHITEVRSLSGARVTYEYDNDYQLRKEKHRNAAGAITLDQSYEYDFLGNRLSKIVGAARTTYTYDKANHLLQQGSLTYTHDHVGNTTSRGDTNFVYNTDRELTEVKRAGATIATYDYNHHGMRTKKVAGSRTEHYYYTGKDLAYITDAQNRIRSSFVRDALGQLMTYTDHTGASPKTYLYVLNHRGDVLGLRDEGGIMVVTYTYDAYGTIIGQTGNGLTGDGRLLREANPFRYASYVYDEETSLYYVQTRYYDADTGRFLTRDIVADTNLYIYADNNPVNFVDPDGRVPIPLIIFLAKAGFKAYTAYSTYKAIKNDPSMKNILLSLMPGGKITRMGGKKILAFAKGNKGVVKAADKKLFRRFDYHFEKHVLGKHGGKKEFRNITRQQYLNRALDLATSRTNSDVVRRTLSGGREATYRHSTKELVIVHNGKDIGTFFKPDKGFKYFQNLK
ncbi:RHS repeat-associated core domain-containing protein [Paenalkalicoccus suaedae]|uniref:RHS repeat-associated core domain-containing protein n=1 Tax=Paenalkalicoccus suaedae TaxID=2592382 RepID=A0A859FI21_9BACI|nr:RHS repeat-associated core domain-containing protein [Paenalkalicoccus suaedae]QKS72324.1 RHS repeat-associated core domain-containing protein [Paenalkalicoccus suaedae]